MGAAILLPLSQMARSPQKRANGLRGMGHEMELHAPRAFLSHMGVALVDQVEVDMGKLGR